MSTNTPFRSAVIAGGRLVTIYGESVAARDEIGSFPDWSVQLPLSRQPWLVPADQLVLVTAGDGSTYALHLADGTLAWRTVPPLPATTYTLRATSLPGTVVTTASTRDETASSFVYATDARTGRLRWTRPALSVLGGDQEITLLLAERAVEALDTETGVVRWRSRAPAISVHADMPPAALTSTTVVVAQGDAATAFDRSTGRVRWQRPDTTTAAAAGEVVVVRTSDGVIAGLDARTGGQRWYRNAERDRQEVAVAPDGHVLLLDSDLVGHVVEE